VALAVLVAWAESAVLVALAESAVLEESVALGAPVVSAEPVVWVVPAESAGATGHRSGSTTRSTVVEPLTEIELQPTGSAA
jgi:hypothetical protein